MPKPLVETRVTYTIEFNSQIFMIENVSARVNEEMGEQLFAPSTVESIQRLVLNRRTPDRFTEVPVYNYAAYGSSAVDSLVYLRMVNWALRGRRSPIDRLSQSITG